MLAVCAIAAAIWFGGGMMRVPRQLRLGLLAVMLGALILVHLTLPPATPLRQATGREAGPWLALAGMIAVFLMYRSGLRWLRGRAPQEAPQSAQPKGTFSETELDRYARHIVLREVGGPGQKALRQARVLVVGAGGLGAPVLQYLAAAGVGTIGVIDDDVVENANLQRQVIHPDRAIGMPKVFSAQEQLQAQNPFVTALPYNRRLTQEIAADLVAEFDLVLDGTDNFTTRYVVNAACVAAGKPLVSGALSQWEGQVSVFDPRQGAPCYQCIFDEAPAPHLAPSCAEAGVIGPLPGVVGSMMAVEAIKLITGAGTPLRGQMVIYDALYGESRQIKVSRRAGCPTCGGGPEARLTAAAL